MFDGAVATFTAVAPVASDMRPPGEVRRRLPSERRVVEHCWLATNEALLHAEGRSRMTVGGLIEYVAREQMHAAAAEEVTASV